jgi:ankyrin repeat protein
MRLKWWRNAPVTVGMTVLSVLAFTFVKASGEEVLGWTPLHLAAASGSTDLTASLLRLGAGPDVWNMSHRTPLYEAAKRGHLEVVQVLAAAGADLRAGRGTPGHTPLHTAVEYGHVHVVEYLISQGVEVDIRNGWAQTPLWQYSWRVGSSDPRIGDLLIRHGADVNAPDYKGFTPVHVAAEAGITDVIRLLAANGADVNARTYYGQHTPLDRAAVAGRSDAVRLLVELGTAVDARGPDGQTSLHRAAAGNRPDVVRQLLELGADPDARRADDATPLLIAAWAGYERVATALLEAGADPALADGADWTPLAAAACRARTAVVQLLLEHGAELDPTPRRMPPVQLAAERGLIEIVSILVDAGADRTNPQHHIGPFVRQCKPYLAFVESMVETSR